LLELIDTIPIAQTWAVRRSPGFSIVRKITGAGEIVSQVAEVISPTQNPERFGDQGEDTIVSVRRDNNSLKRTFDPQQLRKDLDLFFSTGDYGRAVVTDVPQYVDEGIGYILFHEPSSIM
jgi:hypothetical protein